jgi:hypothetical protein
VSGGFSLPRWPAGLYTVAIKTVGNMQDGDVQQDIYNTTATSDHRRAGCRRHHEAAQLIFAHKAFQMK